MFTDLDKLFNHSKPDSELDNLWATYSCVVMDSTCTCGKPLAVELGAVYYDGMDKDDPEAWKAHSERSSCSCGATFFFTY